MGPSLCIIVLTHIYNRPFLLTWSRAPWTAYGQDPSGKFSDQTTLCLDRVGQETTGLRDITQKVSTGIKLAAVTSVLLSTYDSKEHLSHFPKSHRKHTYSSYLKVIGGTRTFDGSSFPLEPHLCASLISVHPDRCNYDVRCHSLRCLLKLFKFPLPHRTRT